MRFELLNERWDQIKLTNRFIEINVQYARERLISVN